MKEKLYKYIVCIARYCCVISFPDSHRTLWPLSCVIKLAKIGSQTAGWRQAPYEAGLKLGLSLDCFT